LGEAHVDSLTGSAIAKHRMETILKTLHGELTIPEASALLGICESRFHAMRRQWLQESVELLEPRQVGRPSVPRAENEDELQRLRVEQERLRRELEVAEVRQEINHILGSSSGALPVKKKTKRRRTPANRK
jgi:hypothetical protein